MTYSNGQKWAEKIYIQGVPKKRPLKEKLITQWRCFHWSNCFYTDQKSVDKIWLIQKYSQKVHVFIKFSQIFWRSSQNFTDFPKKAPHSQKKDLKGIQFFSKVPKRDQSPSSVTYLATLNRPKNSQNQLINSIILFILS